MSLLEKYLGKVYNEEMAEKTETYQLELVGKDITGMVNGKDIGKVTMQSFTQKYPHIAKEILPILQKDGMAEKFAPDKKPPYDFVKSPTTRHKLQATPDIDNGNAEPKVKSNVTSKSQLHTLTKEKRTPTTV